MQKHCSQGTTDREIRWTLKRHLADGCADISTKPVLSKRKIDIYRRADLSDISKPVRAQRV